MIFSAPTNTTTGTEHFCSFDYGDAHFACLYVPMLASNSMTVPYMLFPGSAQYQWLTYSISQQDALSEQFWAIYHCLRVSIHGSTMRVEAINQYGNPFEETVIQRALAPPQTWQATWHTARLDLAALPPSSGGTFFRVKVLP